MQNKNPLSIFGVDLNEYKYQVDFNTLSRKVDFVYLRSSGSSTGKFREDKKFVEYSRECRRYKIPVGAYHFGAASSNILTADLQCDQFIEVIQKGFGTGDFGDIFPVLDVELPIEKILTTKQLVLWIDRFRKRFENKTRRKLMLYTGVFFINIYDDFKVDNTYPLKDMPIWISLYSSIPSNPPYPPNVGGWIKWTVWQYSENGKIEGVNPQPVDLNWGPNSLDFLTPPKDVKGLFATMDKNNIYVTWRVNLDNDISGYNLFINETYVTTLGKGKNYYSILKNKYNLQIGKQVKISIEAFDAQGDFSKNKTNYIISNDRNNTCIKEKGMYIMGDIILRT